MDRNKSSGKNWSRELCEIFSASPPALKIIIIFLGIIFILAMVVINAIIVSFLSEQTDAFSTDFIFMGVSSAIIFFIIFLLRLLTINIWRVKIVLYFLFLLIFSILIISDVADFINGEAVNFLSFFIILILYIFSIKSYRQIIGSRKIDYEEESV